jgi:uncharacterized Zn-finger protein
LVKNVWTKAVQGGLGIAAPGRYGRAPNGFFGRRRKDTMADRVIPHFQNDAGLPIIEIGARKFMCVGATPPFDHPHVFLDMGADNEIVCPYCSTLYRHDAGLGASQSRPPECALPDPVTV